MRLLELIGMDKNGKMEVKGTEIIWKYSVRRLYSRARDRPFSPL